MPVDPAAPQPLTPEARSTDKLAELERKVAALESRSMPQPWITPTLLNGFVNAGSGQAPAGYYIDTQGRVYLRGVLAGVEMPAGVVAFVLGEGYRPAYLHRFVAPTGTSFEGAASFVTIVVATNGNVTVDSGSGYNSLDGVSFRTV